LTFSKALLLQAVTLGDRRTLANMIANGADVNAANNGGQTLLIIAVISAQSDLVRMLLNAGANPFVKDHTGLNARDWAQRKGRAELVALLDSKRVKNPSTTTQVGAKNEPAKSEPSNGSSSSSTAKPSTDEEKSLKFVAGLRQRMADSDWHPATKPALSTPEATKPFVTEPAATKSVVPAAGATKPVVPEGEAAKPVGPLPAANKRGVPTAAPTKAILPETATKPAAPEHTAIKPTVLESAAIKSVGPEAPVAKPVGPQPSATKAIVPENAATKPVVPEPPVTKPIIPESAATEPVVPEPPTKPVVPAPAATTPVTPDPINTKPIVPEPPATKSVVTAVAAAKPVVPEPTTTKPVLPEPAATKPAVPEPPATKPVIPEAAAPKPTVTESAAKPAAPEPDPTKQAVSNSTKTAPAAKTQAATKPAVPKPAVPKPQPSVSRESQTRPDAQSAAGRDKMEPDRAVRSNLATAARVEIPRSDKAKSPEPRGRSTAAEPITPVTPQLPPTTRVPEPVPRASSKRKRCPQCGTIYNSELLAYCAYHVVPLVDADAPLLTTQNNSSSSWLWVFVLLTLIAAFGLTLFVGNSLFRNNPSANLNLAATPLTNTVKGIPVAGGQLLNKAGALVQPEVPRKAGQQLAEIFVRVKVNRSGRVVDATSTAGEQALRDAAIAAAKKSTFSVEKLGGRGANGTITYTFTP